MKMTIKVYSSRGAEWDIPLPAVWVICSACEGCATDRGASVECDGGGFTASEWAEQDEDFRQDYIAGRYDRPCSYCDGLGRVQEIDENAKLDWRQRIFLKAYREQLRDAADCAAIHAAERRMGA